MVQICCSKEISRTDIEKLFEKYDISCINITENDQLMFFEVETKMLRERGLCCWGKYNETIISDESFDRFKDNQKIVDVRKDIITKSRELIFQDVSFWLMFVREFLKRYSFIGLRRYYSDVDVDKGVKEIIVDELDDIMLLNIDVNQTLLIKRP